MKVGILDLGSSAFRLLVAQVDGDGVIEPLLEEREEIELGRVIDKSPVITGRTATAVMGAVARLSRKASKAEVDHMAVVATSAFRDVRNRSELARGMSKAAGHPIRFLSGEEEAETIFRAVDAGVELAGERTLTVDLGGGSLDLAVGENGRILWSGSLALGASRLTARYIRHDPWSKREREAMQKHVRRSLDRIASHLGELQPARCVGTGGKIKALGRLVAEKGPPTPSVHGQTLRLAQLKRVERCLVAAKRADRLDLPGMSRRRVDHLGAAAVVLSRTMSLAGFDELTICEWGLREGLILMSTEPEEQLSLVR